MSDIDFIKSLLPAGWECEWTARHGYYAVIHAPNKQGMVTIDFARRVFRSGLNTLGRTDSVEKYNGRGWKKRIVNDAVSWLRYVLK